MAADVLAMQGARASAATVFTAGVCRLLDIIMFNVSPTCDYTAYVDYMDLTVSYPRKAIKLNHAPIHQYVLAYF